MSKKRHRSFDEREQRREQFVTPSPSGSRPLPWTWIVIGAGFAFLGLSFYVSVRTNTTGNALAQPDVQVLSEGQDVVLARSLFDDGRARVDGRRIQRRRLAKEERKTGGLSVKCRVNRAVPVESISRWAAAEGFHDARLSIRKTRRSRPVRV